MRPSPLVYILHLLLSPIQLLPGPLLQPHLAHLDGLSLGASNSALQKDVGTTTLKSDEEMQHEVKHLKNVKSSPPLQVLIIGREACGAVLVKLLLFDIFLCRTSVWG